MEYNHEWAERSRRQKILETKWEKPEKCGFELAVPDWCQVIYTQGTRGEDKSQFYVKSNFVFYTFVDLVP